MTGPESSMIAPWLTTADASAAVAFYRAAFDAEVIEEMGGGGVTEVACLQVGAAEFWVQRDDDPPAPAAVRMIIVTDEPDLLFDRAVAAGATVVAGMHDEHGWRTGRLQDPFGFQWETARPEH